MGGLLVIRSNGDKKYGSSSIYYSWQFDKSYKGYSCILNNISGLEAYSITVCYICQQSYECGCIALLI